MLFRLVRPHAIFSWWHWKLTAMLLLGYLIAGLVSGAAAGATAWILRRRTQISAAAAATFTLVLAFALNLALHTEAHRFWLLGACGVFGGLLLIPRWNARAGWLTNYWIVSGLLLGFGQEFVFQEMGVASQLGARLGMASIVLAVLLVAGAAGSVLLGRKFRLPSAPLRSRGDRRVPYC